MPGPLLLFQYSLTSWLFKFSTVPISEGAGESRAIKRGMMEGRGEFKKMTERKEWTCYVLTSVLESLCTLIFQWIPNIFSKNMAIAACTLASLCGPLLLFQYSLTSWLFYTVLRASCIGQNENGSCEAGPNSKCWWSFITPMVLFPIRWTDDG